MTIGNQYHTSGQQPEFTELTVGLFNTLRDEISFACMMEGRNLEVEFIGKLALSQHGHEQEADDAETYPNHCVDV